MILALLFSAISANAQSPDCAFEYQRADGMWADAGKPSSSLGTGSLELALGSNQTFITDWRYEKQAGDALNRYGSHVRVVRNTGRNPVQLLTTPAPGQSEVFTLPPGHRKSVKADLNEVRCIRNETLFSNGNDCILRYQRGKDAFAPHGVPNLNRVETLRVSAGSIIPFQTDWKFQKETARGNNFFGSHLRLAKNEGPNEIVLTVFGPNLLGWSTSGVVSAANIGPVIPWAYDYKVVLAPGEEKKLLADLKTVSCTTIRYEDSYVNSPLQVLLTNGERFFVRPKEGDIKAAAGMTAKLNSDLSKMFLVDRNRGMLRSGDTVHFSKPMDDKEKYWLAAVNGGGQNLSMHAKAVGAWETWKIEKIDGSDDVIRHGDKIALKSSAGCGGGGCYLTATGSAVAATGSNRVSPDSTWQIWFKVQPIEAGPFAGQAQWCFGGQGPGCEGVKGLDMVKWRKEKSDDDYDYYSVEILSSLGSIAHDNCCLRSPLGKACSGMFFGARNWRGEVPKFGTASDIGDSSNDSCSQEWQKAWDSAIHEKLQFLGDVARAGSGAADTYANFIPEPTVAASVKGTAKVVKVTADAVNFILPKTGIWWQRFGLYKVPKKLNCPGCSANGLTDDSKVAERAWGFNSDPLMPSNLNRRMQLPHLVRFGGLHIPEETFPIYSYNPYRGAAEVQAYNLMGKTALVAPKGTKISKGDKDFCESRTAKDDLDPRIQKCD